MDDDAQSGVRTVTMADIPFEAIREHWRSLPTWPPHFAVAWVAQPTWEEIVAQARRQTGGPGMREASEAVLAALKDGRLAAYGMREDGSMGRKSPERITPEEWVDLIWVGGSVVAPAINKRTGKEVFRDVQIDRLDLFRLHPAVIQHFTETVEQNDNATKPCLHADRLRLFVKDEKPPPGLSKNDLFLWLQDRAKPKGFMIHRGDVRRLHGSEIYPNVAARGRRVKSAS